MPPFVARRGGAGGDECRRPALGEAPARQGEVGCLYDLVPIAWQHGFFWGGNFPRRPDGMHFEVGDIALD